MSIFSQSNDVFENFISKIDPKTQNADIVLINETQLSIKHIGYNPLSK